MAAKPTERAFRAVFPSHPLSREFSQRESLLFVPLSIRFGFPIAFPSRGMVVTVTLRVTVTDEV